MWRDYRIGYRIDYRERRGIPDSLFTDKVNLDWY